MFEFKIRIQTKLRNEENKKKIERKDKKKKNKRATWADCLIPGPWHLSHSAQPTDETARAPDVSLTRGPRMHASLARAPRWFLRLSCGFHSSG
jgi:hypothetical protein